MPRIVDHEQRRREVTDVAARLVAEQGRRALTVRRVAEVAGYSTTVVSHYFADVGDLLTETYRHAARRARVRIEAVAALDPDDLVGLVEAVLPLDQERMEDWRIWFAFWSEALSSPALADEQRGRARGTADRIHGCLLRLAERGEVNPGTDPRTAADQLAALIPGIAAEAVFDPDRWSPAHQRAVLHDAVRALGIRVTRSNTA